LETVCHIFVVPIFSTKKEIPKIQKKTKFATGVIATRTAQKIFSDETNPYISLLLRNSKNQNTDDKTKLKA
jgi:hypothetical protein